MEEIIEELDKPKLIILGGRTGMGKTTFTLELCEDLALQINKNNNILIFSLELSKQTVQNRLATNENIYINDTPNITITAIEEQCRKMKQNNNINFVAIDYLQLINDITPREEIIQRLKDLTRELNITIFVVSQLSSKTKNNKPTIQDFVLSKSVVDLADKILFLYHTNYRNIKLLKLEVAKGE